LALSKYPGVFFHFLIIFIFRPGDHFRSKFGPKPTEPKNCWFWLKSGTLLPWVNT